MRDGTLRGQAVDRWRLKREMVRLRKEKRMSDNSHSERLCVWMKYLAMINEYTIKTDTNDICN